MSWPLWIGAVLGAVAVELAGAIAMGKLLRHRRHQLEEGLLRWRR